MVLFLVIVALALVIAGIVQIARHALVLGIVLIVVGALVFLLRHEVAANTPEDTTPRTSQEIP